MTVVPVDGARPGSAEPTPIRSRTVPDRTSSRSGPPRVRRGAALAVVLGVTVLAGCGSDLGSPAAATRQGDAFLNLWRVFLVLAIAVAGLIWVLVGWSVIRYRRRSREQMPSQRQYNIPLEIAYLATPLLLVAVLFGLTVVATDEFTSLADDPDLTVEVEGFQWQWQFRYQDEGVTVSGTDQGRPQLVLPVGETVRLVLRSTDVIHSFWVPDFLEKRDLIPNVDNQIDVEVVAPGEWVGRCAEYCGLDHWTMQFTVRAVAPDEFRAWLDEARQEPQPVLAGADAGSAQGGR